MNFSEVLIEKHWLDQVKRSVCDLFWEEVVKAPSKSEVSAVSIIVSHCVSSQLPPVIATPKLYLIHVYRCGLFFLSTADSEVAPLLVIELQHRIIDMFLQYFKKVNDGVIKENFSIIYQVH